MCWYNREASFSMYFFCRHMFVCFLEETNGGHVWAHLGKPNKAIASASMLGVAWCNRGPPVITHRAGPRSEDLLRWCTADWVQLWPSDGAHFNCHLHSSPHAQRVLSRLGTLFGCVL